MLLTNFFFQISFTGLKVPFWQFFSFAKMALLNLFLWISQRSGTLNWERVSFWLSKNLYSQCGQIMPPPLHCVFKSILCRHFKPPPNVWCHVWCHFYKIEVVLKYHRRPSANIFDTDICRGNHLNIDFYASTNAFKHDLYWCTWRWFQMSL